MAEKKPRQDMPRQKPEMRNKNFKEVALGYTEELALTEASRCLGCKKPLCVKGCPVEIDIPAFITLIKEKKYIQAIQKIKEKNCLPAVCGRVCPQEDQCEKFCILGKKGESVAIGRLERFAADYELKQGVKKPKQIEIPINAKKIAIIGSGPSGLTVAGELVRKGYKVTVFEAFHKAGGVLVYGIPEFRLPKDIVQKEVDYIENLGVEIKTNWIIGRIKTIDDLLNEEGYDAVYICSGAGLPYFMDIPGENYNGVYSANEYLTRSNLMKAYEFPKYDTPIKKSKKIAVVGGGNVAMDSSRTALRLEAEDVYLIYRRSMKEMPARNEEIENAREEGIKFKLLTNPVEILGDEKGWVKAIKCIKMELGEPDDSGRRRPVPIKGSEFELEVDTVIMAIGNGANPLISSTTPDLEINKWGYIVTKDEAGRTSKKGVYAGGDIVTGSATVILAMGAGKKAAKAIDEYLKQ